MRDKTATGDGRSRLRRLVSALPVLALVAGSAGAAAAATHRTSAAPANSSSPTISGTFQAGETVKASSGSWKNDPTSYSYQWVRCNQSGDGCADIDGADSKSYKLASADVDHTVRVQVTAVNQDGKDTSSSSPSPVVSDTSAPRNTGRPAISGTPRVGEGLKVSNGSWTGGVRGYAYQWQRCDKEGNNCVDVDGATGAAYSARSSDAGSTLRAEVTASNGAGKTTVSTDRSDVVQASTSPPPSAGATSSSCSNGGSVAAASLAAPVRLLVDRFSFAPSVVTPTTDTITARIHVADTCGRSVAGVNLWSTAIPYNQTSAERGTTGSTGWATLTYSVQGGFPANPGRQQILAVLIRATKPGGSVLAGVSARRVVRENVNLHR